MHFAGFRLLSVVTASRLLIAVFALLAVYVDPLQPARNANLAYWVLSGFLVWSVALVVAGKHFARSWLMRWIIDATDFAIPSILIYLGDGPSSPFFVFFTFALFAGMLQGGWRGAWGATMITVFLYAGLSFISGIDFEEDLRALILRLVYLTVAGGLFAYFGALLDNTRQKFADLAAWPRAVFSQSAVLDLTPALAHCAKVTGTERVLAVWEDDHEPMMYFAEHTAETTRAGSRKRQDHWNLSPESESDSDNQNGGPTPDWIAYEFDARLGRAFKFRNDVCTGVVIFVGDNIDDGYFDSLLLLAAHRIGLEIESHDLRCQLLETAAVEGRAILARDVHDSTLQALAAAAIRLKMIEKSMPAREAERLADCREILQVQQSRLRGLLASATAHSGDQKTSVVQSMAALAKRLRRQWNCEIEVSVDVQSDPLDEEILEGIILFLEEAVANGVRHGLANRFQIRFRNTDGVLKLSIRDNGGGLPNVSGYISPDVVALLEVGSRSLQVRAASLGGELSLASNVEGLNVQLTVPV